MFHIFSFYLVIYMLAQSVTTLNEYLLCEGDDSTMLECCQECSIQILQAKYGRTNSLECKHDSVFDSKEYNCTFSTRTVVSDVCDGNRVCLPKSSNKIYGDPCPSVYKYLNVTYNCLKTATTTEKTTANIDLTTSYTDTDPFACRCPCSLVGANKWGYLRDLNLSLAQLEEILKPDLNILQNLIAINKTNTTMNLRTKYSAADDRISAVSIGYVGATIICLVLAFFVVMDLIECFR